MAKKTLSRPMTTRCRSELARHEDASGMKARGGVASTEHA
jgi:hypothetical protein